MGLQWGVVAASGNLLHVSPGSIIDNQDISQSGKVCTVAGGGELDFGLRGSCSGVIGLRRLRCSPMRMFS